MPNVDELFETCKANIQELSEKPNPEQFLKARIQNLESIDQELSKLVEAFHQIEASVTEYSNRIKEQWFSSLRAGAKKLEMIQPSTKTMIEQVKQGKLQDARDTVNRLHTQLIQELNADYQEISESWKTVQKINSFIAEIGYINLEAQQKKIEAIHELACVHYNLSITISKLNQLIQDISEHKDLIQELIHQLSDANQANVEAERAGIVDRIDLTQGHQLLVQITQSDSEQPLTLAREQQLANLPKWQLIPLANQLIMVQCPLTPSVMKGILNLIQVELLPKITSSQTLPINIPQDFKSLLNIGALRWNSLYKKLSRLEDGQSTLALASQQPQLQQEFFEFVDIYNIYKILTSSRPYPQQALQIFSTHSVGTPPLLTNVAPTFKANPLQGESSKHEAQITPYLIANLFNTQPFINIPSQLERLTGQRFTADDAAAIYSKIKDQTIAQESSRNSVLPSVEQMKLNMSEIKSLRHFMIQERENAFIKFSTNVELGQRLRLESTSKFLQQLLILKSTQEDKQLIFKSDCDSLGLNFLIMEYFQDGLETGNFLHDYHINYQAFMELEQNFIDYNKSTINEIKKLNDELVHALDTELAKLRDSNRTLTKNSLKMTASNQQTYHLTTELDKSGQELTQPKTSLFQQEQLNDLPAPRQIQADQLLGSLESTEEKKPALLSNIEQPFSASLSKKELDKLERMGSDLIKIKARIDEFKANQASILAQIQMLSKPLDPNYYQLYLQILSQHVLLEKQHKRLIEKTLKSLNDIHDRVSQSSSHEIVSTNIDKASAQTFHAKTDHLEIQMPSVDELISLTDSSIISLSGGSQHSVQDPNIQSLNRIRSNLLELKKAHEMITGILQNYQKWTQGEFSKIDLMRPRLEAIKLQIEQGKLVTAHQLAESLNTEVTQQSNPNYTGALKSSRSVEQVITAIKSLGNMNFDEIAKNIESILIGSHTATSHNLTSPNHFKAFSDAIMINQRAQASGMTLQVDFTKTPSLANILRMIERTIPQSGFDASFWQQIGPISKQILLHGLQNYKFLKQYSFEHNEQPGAEVVSSHYPSKINTALKELIHVADFLHILLNTALSDEEKFQQITQARENDPTLFQPKVKTFLQNPQTIISPNTQIPAVTFFIPIRSIPFSHILPNSIAGIPQVISPATKNQQLIVEAVNSVSMTEASTSKKEQKKKLKQQTEANLKHCEQLKTEIQQLDLQSIELSTQIKTFHQHEFSGDIQRNISEHIQPPHVVNSQKQQLERLEKKSQGLEEQIDALESGQRFDKNKQLSSLSNNLKTVLGKIIVLKTEEIKQKEANLRLKEKALEKLVSTVETKTQNVSSFLEEPSLSTKEAQFPLAETTNSAQGFQPTHNQDFALQFCNDSENLDVSAMLTNLEAMESNIKLFFTNNPDLFQNNPQIHAIYKMGLQLIETLTQLQDASPSLALSQTINTQQLINNYLVLAWFNQQISMFTRQTQQERNKVPDDLNMKPSNQLVQQNLFPVQHSWPRGPISNPTSSWFSAPVFQLFNTRLSPESSKEILGKLKQAINLSLERQQSSSMVAPLNQSLSTEYQEATLPILTTDAATQTIPEDSQVLLALKQENQRLSSELALVKQQLFASEITLEQAPAADSEEYATKIQQLSAENERLREQFNGMSDQFQIEANQLLHLLEVENDKKTLLLSHLKNFSSLEGTYSEDEQSQLQRINDDLISIETTIDTLRTQQGWLVTEIQGACQNFEVNQVYQLHQQNLQILGELVSLEKNVQSLHLEKLILLLSDLRKKNNSLFEIRNQTYVQARQTLNDEKAQRLETELGSIFTPFNKIKLEIDAIEIKHDQMYKNILHDNLDSVDENLQLAEYFKTAEHFIQLENQITELVQQQIDKINRYLREEIEEEEEDVEPLFEVNSSLQPHQHQERHSKKSTQTFFSPVSSAVSDKDHKWQLYAALEKPEPLPSLQEFLGVDPITLNTQNDTEFASHQGKTVFVPTTGHPFQFHYEKGKAPRATLSEKDAGNPQGENYKHNLALDVINMMDNILSKGPTLYLDTKDSYIADIAYLYVEYLGTKGLHVDAHITHNGEQLLSHSQESEKIAKRIVEYPFIANVKDSAWFKEAQTHSQVAQAPTFQRH